MPEWAPASNPLPYQVIAATDYGLNLTVQDPITGKTNATHSENTRIVPNHDRIFLIFTMIFLNTTGLLPKFYKLFPEFQY